jgi:hypothetical protein
MELPNLPVPVANFISYLKGRPDVPVHQTTEPFRVFENNLREVFAQEPDHSALRDPYVNALPIFTGNERDLKIRARDLAKESKNIQEKYLFPLKPEVRKPDGAPAVVMSIKDFKSNFNLFCESSLADLNWNNVVAAGSSVVTSLLPVPPKWADSKRTQRYGAFLPFIVLTRVTRILLLAGVCLDSKSQGILSRYSCACLGCGSFPLRTQ